MQPITLFQLNTLVKETLEQGLPGRYWVQGEISEGRPGYNGHFYGEMVQKDEQSGAIMAKARITCWANTFRQLAQKFQEATGETLRAGLTVMVEVTVSFHQQYGYSLTITNIDPSYTLGDMARRRQEILRQLEKDGILHDNQTLTLPLLTQRIAVISSATAAGYGDFCNQVQNNELGFWFHLQLFPAVMQGSRVPETIIAALEQIAAESDQWDAVVIIRGGGATSDLSDFDSYPLAACIAQMPLPVITGIGHERDETVLDYVAHTHLKTPTAVAAFLIDHLATTAAHIDELSQRITRSVTERLARELQRLVRLASVLPLAFQTVRQRQEHRIETLLSRMQTAHRERQLREQHRLQLMEQRLQSLDPALLLQRGYSMTLADGKLLRDASQVRAGQTLVTRLAKGTLISVVTQQTEIQWNNN
ncbi:MAG: exodeoxyribonuclease VII large subunit [Bacteroidaceae bacterium]|nr:exodeoxyribonuclease VII large subunit [Bacteroidaceae bacterium]